MHNRVRVQQALTDRSICSNKVNTEKSARVIISLMSNECRWLFVGLSDCLIVSVRQPYSRIGLISYLSLMMSLSVVFVRPNLRSVDAKPIFSHLLGPMAGLLIFLAAFRLSRKIVSDKEILDLNIASLTCQIYS